MAIYILLSTLTPEGRQTMHKNPDRLLEVNKEIENFGCKIIQQYAVLGAYDFISIIEAADNETAAHLAIDIGSRGTINLITLPAMTIGDLSEKLKGPSHMGHR